MSISLKLSLLVLILLHGITAENQKMTSSVFTDEDINNPDLILVHVIPHSHNDPGWLFTFEQYYLGTNSLAACVKCILDRMPDALEANPKRKFMYVEMVFFTRWWQDQTAEMKARVHKLVASGQLELIQAGWVMNDEASSYYEDVIDHMSLGHAFVKKEFNITPTVGWAIDPFGHSTTQVKFLRQMGFNGWIIERIDEQDHLERKRTKSLEMLWTPVENREDDPYDNALFTHVNYHLYWTPPVAARGIFNGPNDAGNAGAFANYVRNEAKAYRTRHLIHHIGGDFVWGYGAETPNLFVNLEQAMEYFNVNNRNEKIRLGYSNPHLYVESIYNETLAKPSLQIPLKRDDFFPYSDKVSAGAERKGGAYWSGFFTTRTNFKFNIRQGGRRIQAIRKLVAKLLYSPDSVVSSPDLANMTASINVLERAVGICQHHDGITGTAKQAVTDNYIWMLTDGMANTSQLMYNLLNNRFKLYEDKTPGAAPPAYSECRLNETSDKCEFLTGVTTKENVLLTVYNPGGYGTRMVKVKVPNYAGVTVKNETGDEIPSDLICELYSGYQRPGADKIDNNFNDCIVYFPATFTEIGFRSFLLVPSETSNEKAWVPVTVTNGEIPQTIDFKVSNDTSLKMLSPTLFEVKRCKKTGCLRNTFDLSYRAYYSRANAQPQSEIGADGAYLFNTDGDSFEYGGNITLLSYVKGTVHSAILVRRHDVIMRLKLFHDLADYGFEIETFLDSVPTDDNRGKNVVLHVRNEDIFNGGEFWTDQNGINMMQRIYNQRYTYTPTYLPFINVSAAFFPITSATFIKDQRSRDQMTVMTDRAQGASSQKTSELDLMIQRRLKTDDDRGVQEFLNEFEPGLAGGVGMRVRLHHWILFSNTHKGFDLHQRKLQKQIDNPLIVLMSKTNLTDFKTVTLSHHTCSEDRVQAQIKSRTQHNLKIWMQPVENSEFIVRIQNLHDTNHVNFSFLHTTDESKLALGSGQASKQFIPLLDDILLCGHPNKSREIIKIQEESLSANQPMTDVVTKQYKWLKKNSSEQDMSRYTNYTMLDIEPLEIRTFRINFGAMFDNIITPKDSQKDPTPVIPKPNITEPEPTHNITVEPNVTNRVNNTPPTNVEPKEEPKQEPKPEPDELKKPIIKHSHTVRKCINSATSLTAFVAMIALAMTILIIA